MFEDSFARNIFYPYAQQELDDWGVRKGVLRSIPYDEWLLKFVINIQWRLLASGAKRRDEQLRNERSRNRFDDAIDVALGDRAEYLLGKSETGGQERHCIIFLQIVTVAEGDFPERLNDKVIMYLLRSVDGTLARSSSNLLLYGKLGPIVLVSGLRPYELKGMKDAQVRRRGVFVSLRTCVIQR